MTRGGRLALGASAAAVVAAAAIWVNAPRDEPVTGGTALFPELDARIADVASIEARGSDGEARVVRRGDAWVVPAVHDHPADVARVRALVVALAEASVIEPKTRRPERYPELGLADPGSEGAESVGVRLESEGGEVLAEAVIGDRRDGGSGYVRLAGDPQSYLVDRAIEVADTASDWLDRTVLDVARSDIRDIRVEHRDGEPVEIVAADPAGFELANLPEGRQVRFQYAVNDFAATLSGLDFAEVEPLGDTAFDGLLRGRFSTRDGVIVGFRTSSGEHPWYRFEATIEGEGGEEIEQRVAALNARWSEWKYRIGEGPHSRLAKPLDELVEEEPVEEAPAGNPTSR